MYFNKEGLLKLFQTDSFCFDIEGALLVNRLESDNISSPENKYRKCFCRLRGNILFIIENNLLQPIKPNVIFESIILNDYKIEVEKNSNIDFFLLNCKSKNFPFFEKFHFISHSINDRDQWIQCISKTSFNFLKSLRSALSDELKKKSKIINENHESNLSNFDENRPTDQSNVVFMSLYCDNITTLTDSHFFIKVFCCDNIFDYEWNYIGSTETIFSKSPQFSSCLLLSKQTLNSQNILFKFELFNVVEKRYQISFLQAFSFFKFEKPVNLLFNDIQYTLDLICSKTSQIIGALTFNLFSENKHLKKSNSIASKKQFLLKKNDSNSVSNMNHFKIFNEQHLIFNQSLERQFAFNINLNKQSNVIFKEILQDSKFVFLIPNLFLKFFVEHEKSIAKLISNNKSLFKDFSEKTYVFHQKFADQLNEIIKEIENFSKIETFRSSKNKLKLFLQFVPINLHKQVFQLDKSGSSFLKIFSVGAYTCHHLGFENGSIKSILTNKKFSQAIEAWNIQKKLIKVLNIENKIEEFFSEISCHPNQIQSFYQKIEIYLSELSNLISVDEFEFLLAKSNLEKSNELEPIDLINVNLKACMVAVNSKLSEQKYSINQLNRKLTSSIKSLKTMSLFCYSTIISKLTIQDFELLNQLRIRHLSLFSQSLTSFIIFLMDNLNNSMFIDQIKKTGFILIEHETLLSCFSDELAMIEDMVYSLEELSNSVTVSVLFGFENELSAIEIFGDKINLEFKINSPCFKSRVDLQIQSVIFNVGVNHHASLVDNLFRKSYQQSLNCDNFNKLKTFIMRFYQESDRTVINLLSKLQQEIERSKTINKNIEILNLVGQIVNRLNGIKVTCCKSAKDRTGMSITLEETRFAFQCLNLNKELNEHLFQTMLDDLRRNGTRMENVYKNIGIKKYAFNDLQLMTFPKLLVPPKGTYSTNVET